VNTSASAAQQHRTNGTSDEALIAAFGKSASDEAFAALVKKYLGVVLGIAVRRTGDRGLAEEIAQNVFTILARKARRLKPGAPLAGWIHRATMIECAEAMRRECAHRTKMSAISVHLLTHLGGREVWRDALPVLDEAIDALGGNDRAVILLRFFERKSFREIGAALGKSDDAAQKQTERALQKISNFLKRKGIVVSAAVLASGLASRVAQAASAPLVNSIAHSAPIAAVNLTARTLILKSIHAMTYAQSKAALFIAVALAVPIAVQWHENGQLRGELDRSQKQRRELAAMTNARFADAPAQVPQPSPDAELPGADSQRQDSADIDAETLSGDWMQALFMADPLQRAQQISALLGNVTGATAPHIAQAFEKAAQAGLKFPDELRLFLRAWGKTGGAAPIEYAASHWGFHSDEAGAAMGGWASVAPRAARAWLDAQPEGQAKGSLILGLLDGWSTVDFQAAAGYAASLPSNSARDQYSELLLQRALRTGGLAAAQQWVDRIPNDEPARDFKQRAFADVIQTMLYRDPAAAAQWISQLEGQPFVSSEAISRTAVKLAETSPTSALTWLTSLGASGASVIAPGAGDVLQNWAQRDVQAAGTWLRQNAQHPYYDRMAAAFARSVASADRPAAEEWARTIRDETIREEALANLQSTQGALYTSLRLSRTSAAAETLAYIWDTQRLDAQSRSVSLTIHGSNPHGPASEWKNCASCHR
jgi:RNA polymerase sigma factor (sigma-70 family)